MGVGQVREAQPLQQCVDAGVRVRGPGEARAHGQFLAHAAGDELVLGALEDGPDPREQLPRPPPVRLDPRGAVRQDSPRRERAGQRRGEARERDGERGLPRPVEPRDDGRNPRTDRQVDAALHGGGPVPHRSAVRLEEDVAEAVVGGPARPLDLGAGTGHPDARGREGRTPGVEDLCGRAVRGDAAAGLQDEDAVDEVDPLVHTVIDDDEGRGGRRDGAPDLVRARVVEVRGGLVQQEEARLHREHTGDREALSLAAGQVRGGAIERVGEPHRVEGRTDPRPDLLARNREVLQPEGDVVAQRGQDRVGVRVLQDEARPPSLRGGESPVHGERAGLLAVLLIAQDAREAAQQGRLAGAGRAQQEDPLAGLEDEVDPGHGRPPAGGVPPAPPRRDDAGGSGSVSGAYERSRAHARPRISRPAAKRSSAPVRASARVSTQPNAPASRAPEMMRHVR